MTYSEHARAIRRDRDLDIQRVHDEAKRAIRGVKAARDDEVRRLRAEGRGVHDIAKALHLGTRTVSRALNGRIR